MLANYIFTAVALLIAGLIVVSSFWVFPNKTKEKTK